MCLRTIKYILIFFLLLPITLGAVDLYSYAEMSEVPLWVDMPSWHDDSSKLMLKYEVYEAYKKWLGGKKVTDASGYGFNVGLQANIAEHISFGFTKNFSNKQNWINSDKDEMPVFNLRSDNSDSTVFMKIGTDRLRLMIGHGNTNDSFKGHFELNEDIIAALGDEPDISFNTDGTMTFGKIFAEIGRFRLSYAQEQNKYKHKISGETEIMKLDVNHRRKVRIKDIELSYKYNEKMYPYIRYYNYKDCGDGIDYRDERVVIGKNNSNFDFIAKTVGMAYKYKGGWYYADYSRVFADISADIFFNMVNIDVMFLFGTRFVDYDTWFKPGWGNMVRLGFKRHYRKIDYSMQYSLAKLHGDTYKVGEKTKSGGRTRDVQQKDRTLYLHRMDICVTRPDKSGSWNVGLKLMVPQVKTHEDKEDDSGGDGGGSSKKIRGGWQLSIMREFNL